MGCSVCCDCGDKFEVAHAEEYYARVDGIDFSNEDEWFEIEVCPDCDAERRKKKEQAKEMAALKKRVSLLEAELQAERSLREQAEKRLEAPIDLTHLPDSSPPTTKKQKVEASIVGRKVWVIAKADHAEQDSHLARCEVIGTYASEEAAQEALDEYLEDGDWQEGYGYHQGFEESSIEIYPSAIEA